MKTLIYLLITYNIANTLSPYEPCSEIKLPALRFSTTSRVPRYNFGKEQEKTLNEIARWLKENPATAIQVEGHVDKSNSINDDFSAGDELAKYTIDRLTLLGVKRSRLKAISYGSEKPAADDEHQQECQETTKKQVFSLHPNIDKNFRVEFIQSPQ